MKLFVALLFSVSLLVGSALAVPDQAKKAKPDQTKKVLAAKPDQAKKVVAAKPDQCKKVVAAKPDQCKKAAKPDQCKVKKCREVKRCCFRLVKCCK